MKEKIESKPKEDMKTVGHLEIEGCKYDVLVRGDIEGSHEVELVGLSCPMRSNAIKATAVVDAIFGAKRMIYTPPMKFEREEVEGEKKE